MKIHITFETGNVNKLDEARKSMDRCIVTSLSPSGFEVQASHEDIIREKAKKTLENRGSGWRMGEDTCFLIEGMHAPGPYVKESVSFLPEWNSIIGDRNAKWSSKLYLIDPNNNVFYFTEEQEGRFLRQSVIENGFGFDRVFAVDMSIFKDNNVDISVDDAIEHNNKNGNPMVYFSDMTNEQYLKASPRMRAFACAQKFIFEQKQCVSLKCRPYYAASIRSAKDPEKAELIRKQHVDYLQRYGIVNDTISKSETNLDENRSDVEIFNDDMELLKKAQCIIAYGDASHGVGLVIGNSIGKMPILFLHEPKQKVSAMLSGCASVKCVEICNFQDFKFAIDEFMLAVSMRHQRLVLMGPPGAGKSTLGKRLASTLNMQHISTGQLLRSLDKNTELGREVHEIMESGSLVSAPTMQKILKKCLPATSGYILDGYPPSKEDLDVLKNICSEPTLVLYLTLDDEIALYRQTSRGERLTDNDANRATKRIELFHEKVSSFKDIRFNWFKNSIVCQLNATTSIEQVFQNAKSLLAATLCLPRRDRSYYVEGDIDVQETSDRFHIHIDGSPHDVREIAALLSKRFPWQIKLFPIDKLLLGPQCKHPDWAPLYDAMPNFHPIGNDIDELFVTGKIGSVWDDTMMFDALSCASMRKSGAMVEFEEYVYEGSIKANENGADEINKISFESNKTIDKSRLEQFSNALIAKFPFFELHLGFDLPKINNEDDNTIPIPSLQQIMEKCMQDGLINGGWFIFTSNESFKFRSNEFSHSSLYECKVLILQQALALQSILKSLGFFNVKIGFSIEIVHGIYVFN